MAFSLSVRYRNCCNFENLDCFVARCLACLIVKNRLVTYGSFSNNRSFFSFLRHIIFNLHNLTAFPCLLHFCQYICLDIKARGGMCWRPIQTTFHGQRSSERTVFCICIKCFFSINCFVYFFFLNKKHRKRNYNFRFRFDL